jgi:hypothetical protein
VISRCIAQVADALWSTLCGLLRSVRTYTRGEQLAGETGNWQVRCCVVL